MSPGRRAVLVGAVAVIALSGVAAWTGAAAWSPERGLRLLQGTGWCAAVALLLSLSARPAGILLGLLGRRRINIAPWRRLTGITAAALATLHAAIALSTYLTDAWGHVFAIAWLRAGMSALLILFALWVTSFPRVMRALRIQHWKSLHRLAYVAGLLAFQHALLSPFASRAMVLGVFGAALALGLLRLVPALRRRGRPKDP